MRSSLTPVGDDSVSLLDARSGQWLSGTATDEDGRQPRRDDRGP